MEMVKDDQEGCHFVLVHGACHGAWCWYKVAAILKSAGHKVTALDMAACGIHLTQWYMLESFSEYFEPLMEFFKSLQPHEKVILVGHSMGGACISAAMERFPAKISLAVFAAAFMPGPDLSFHYAVQEYTRRLDSYMDSKVMFHEELDTKRSSLVFGPDFLAAKLYQLSPNEESCRGSIFTGYAESCRGSIFTGYACLSFSRSPGVRAGILQWPRRLVWRIAN